MKRRDVGILGEQVARDFLVKEGHCILEVNYRCSEGEVDIITRDGDVLVFVEVRTKTNLAFGSPAESITPVKMDRLRRVAAHYQQHHENLPADSRIDVVAVQMGRDSPVRIEHIENAVGGD